MKKRFFASIFSLFLTLFFRSPIAPSEYAVFPVKATIQSGDSSLYGALAISGGSYYASSMQNSLEPKYAFDGNLKTRWGSLFYDPQWLMVDYGTPQTFNKVEIFWETAYAKSYKIQISNDKSQWTDLYGTTNGDGGQDVITFNSVSARYIRMVGIKRATQWGYSIYEMVVSYEEPSPIATASSQQSSAYAPIHAVDGNLSTRWSSKFYDPQWIAVDLRSQKSFNQVILFWETAYAKSYKVQVSNDNSQWIDVYSSNNGTGGQEAVTFDTVSARYLRIYGFTRATQWGYSLYEIKINSIYIDRTAPTVPANLTVTGQTLNSIGVAWSQSTDDVGVKGYEVDLSNDFTFSTYIAGYQNLDIGNRTDFTFTGLSENSNYSARVRSYDSAGNKSAYSDAVSTKTLSPIPPPPTSWQPAGWYGGGCFPDMVFDENREGRVYLLSDVAGIWRSDNNGESWNFITEGLKNLYVPFLAVAPSNSNILYAGTKSGLYRSDNSGDSWTLLNTMNGEITFLRPQNHVSIAVSNLNPAQLAVGTSKGSVFYTTDSGNSWTILGGNKTPFGNTNPITSLKLSKDNNYLYASSNSGGIAKYSFLTNNWTRLSSGPTASQDLFISYANDQTIYATGGSYLSISTDGGQSWIKSSAVPQGMVTRVVESKDGSTILVVWEQGWDGGVLLTTDKGATWKKADSNMVPDIYYDPSRIWSRSSGARVTSVKISPYNKNILFRTDWWGAWRSEDGGASWKEKIFGAPNTVGSQILVSLNNNIYIASMDNGLLASYDSGISYKMLFPTVYGNSISGHVWRVAVSAEDQKIIATSSPWNENINQVILSSDGGKSFTVVRSGLPLVRPKVNTMWGEGYPRGLAVDPTNFNKVYLGIDGDDGGGLYISQDGGQNWVLSSGQPGSRRIYNGLAVDPTNPQRLFWASCASGGGVYRSEDGGKSWSYVFSQMSWVFDLAIASDGTVYVTGDYGGSPRVYLSKDKGTTWSLLAAFPVQGAGEAIAVDPQNKNNIAVSAHIWGTAAGGKVFVSKDAGQTWTEMNDGLPNGTGMASQTFGPDSTLYGVRYAGSVYKRRI